MKATDLRIGNWVKINLPHKSIIGKIDGLNRVKAFVEDKEGFTTLPIHDIQPIELTEEILVKIGFEKKNDCYILSNECIFFAYYKDSFKQELLASVKRKGKYYYNTNELKNYDIKNLHQLQNAYFILTGEELNIEL